MAILRIMMNDGKTVEFPYDFGETEQRQLAAHTFMSLFWDDIKDADIVPGWIKSSYVEKDPSVTEYAFPREAIISLLHKHAFVQKDAAAELGITKRRMCGIIQRHGLRLYVKKMKVMLEENSHIVTDYAKNEIKSRTMDRFLQLENSK